MPQTQQTPLAAVGDTAVLDVRGFGTAVLHLLGGAVASSGLSAIIEGTLAENPGPNDWFAVSGANAQTPSGSSSAPLTNSAFGIGVPQNTAWKLGVVAYTYVRVRLTARTAGDIVARWTKEYVPTEPSPSAQGTVNAVPPSGTKIAVGTDGAAVLRSLITATAGNLDNLAITNNSDSPASVKVYDKSTAPLATDTGIGVLLMVIPVPARTFLAIPFPNAGQRFAAGLGIAITGGAADNDNTVPPLGVEVTGTRR